MATALFEVVVCPNCGQKNRVPHDARVAVCGKCKTPLSVPSSASGDHPIEVTDATFAELVTRSPVPVLVDLWAPWCGPCRMLAPAIEQLAKQFAGRARVAKLNTEDNQQTAAACRADAIPLLLIFKDGREVERLVGLRPAQQIAERLNAHL